MIEDVLLPWVDGVGRPIHKMQAGVIYTVKHRGHYQVALKADETEAIQPSTDILYRETEQKLLPWVDGVGQPIEKMQVGVTYTVKHRGHYQVALKEGETEAIRPILSGFKSRFHSAVYIDD